MSRAACRTGASCSRNVQGSASFAAWAQGLTFIGGRPAPLAAITARSPPPQTSVQGMPVIARNRISAADAKPSVPCRSRQNSRPLTLPRTASAGWPRRGQRRYRPVTHRMIAHPATTSTSRLPTGPVMVRLCSVLTVCITPPSRIAPSTRPSRGSTKWVMVPPPSVPVTTRQLSASLAGRSSCVALAPASFSAAATIRDGGSIAPCADGNRTG